MLTTFPSLLAYNFFVPMLLRVVVALFFASLAINHFKAKKELATELEHHFKFLSHETSIWVSGLLILAELGVGILLFVGAWTQIAAILAALGFAKMSYFAPSMPRYAPLPRSTYMLLIAICVSLLITGAGAFAFDLPL